MTDDQVHYLHQTQQDSASRSLSFTSLQAFKQGYYLEKQINFVFFNQEAKCLCHLPFTEKKTEASPQGA